MAGHCLPQIHQVNVKVFTNCFPAVVSMYHDSMIGRHSSKAAIEQEPLLRHSRMAYCCLTAVFALSVKTSYSDKNGDNATDVDEPSATRKTSSASSMT